MAYGQRVVHRDEALAYLQSIRDLHPQATHHCYAYRV
ncbi:YigZ family protein [bacterium]|nr:YigZ family protein [bacterium]